MTKNKNLTLWIVKFNTILTMGGEFYLSLQRFYNGSWENYDEF